MRANILIIIALSLIFSINALGQGLSLYLNDSDINKLRNATYPNVIKAGMDSDSEKGVKSPGAAASSVKRNTVLQLMEGNYTSDITITADNVIIEPAPGADPQKILCNLHIAGKNVVIRGMKTERLIISQSVIILDSVIGYLKVAGSNNKKPDLIRFHNCVVGKIYVTAGESRKWDDLITRVSFQNCVIGFRSERFPSSMYYTSYSYNYNGLIELFPNTECSFKQSILYGKNLFTLGWAFVDAKGKVTLDNSLMYSSDVIVNQYTRRTTDKKAFARDMKELKKFFPRNFVMKGKVPFEKPLFKGNIAPAESSVTYTDENGMNYNLYNYTFDFANLALKDGTPGADIKGIGLASLNNGFPGVDSASAANKKSEPEDDDSSEDNNNSGNNDEDDDW